MLTKPKIRLTNALYAKQRLLNQREPKSGTNLAVNMIAQDVGYIGSKIFSAVILYRIYWAAINVRLLP